jgi:hypothetical protein
MAKITHQEHQYNGDLEATETVALYVNGQKFKEYTVTAGNTAKVTFMYQEIAQ